MVIRRYKIKNHLAGFKKLIEGTPLSAKARKLIEIGGKPIKLPKKLLTRPEESYRRLHKKFRQAH